MGSLTSLLRPNPHSQLSLLKRYVMTSTRTWTPDSQMVVLPTLHPLSSLGFAASLVDISTGCWADSVFWR